MGGTKVLSISVLYFVHSWLIHCSSILFSCYKVLSLNQIVSFDLNISIIAGI